MNSILKLIPLTLVLWTTTPAFAETPDGVGHGGGGDAVAAAFAQVAEDAINTLATVRPVYAEGFLIDVDRLKNKFSITSIKSVDRPLTLNGKAVVAINNPSTNEITLDRARWPLLDHAAQVQLAIHEFIGLTFPEISDKNYRYSRQLKETVLTLRREIRIFARLSALSSDSQEASAVLGETLDWVSRKASTSPDALSGFSLDYEKRDGYLDIRLIDPNGKMIFRGKQFLQDTLDFELTLNFPLLFNGRHYDQLFLECQEALGKTP